MYVNDGNRRFGCIRGYFDYITRAFFCDYMYFYSRSKFDPFQLMDVVGLFIEETCLFFDYLSGEGIT